MHLSVAAYIILYFILFIFIHSYLVGANFCFIFGQERNALSMIVEKGVW